MSFIPNNEITARDLWAIDRLSVIFHAAGDLENISPTRDHAIKMYLQKHNYAPTDITRITDHMNALSDYFSSAVSSDDKAAMLKGLSEIKTDREIPVSGLLDDDYLTASDSAAINYMLSSLAVTNGFDMDEQTALITTIKFDDHLIRAGYDDEQERLRLIGHVTGYIAHLRTLPDSEQGEIQKRYFAQGVDMLARGNFQKPGLN